MTILSKLTDALQMFWQALDDEERRIVAYLVVYLGASALMAVQQRADERRRQRIVAELREEITRGAAA